MKIWYDFDINAIYIDSLDLPVAAGSLSCFINSGIVSICLTKTKKTLINTSWSNIFKQDGSAFNTSADCFNYLVGIMAWNRWPQTPEYLLHTESTPSTQWTIVHGFGYYPQVQVFDNQGRQVFADITQNDFNTVTVSFGSTMDGQAILS